MLKYSRPEIVDDNLSREQLLECKQYIQENNLGSNLKPLGRIQGPFATNFDLKNNIEVLFVFDRRLYHRDLWDSKKQQQMIQAAVKTRAVPDFQIQNQNSRNFVNVKNQQPLAQSIGASISRNVGLALSGRL